MNQKGGESIAVRLRDAARMLNVSERTLWSWAQGGLVPCRRIACGGKGRGTLLFSVDALRQWAAQPDVNDGGADASSR
jgi:hypothetical protein